MQWIVGDVEVLAGGDGKAVLVEYGALFNVHDYDQPDVDCLDLVAVVSGRIPLPV